MSDGPTNLERQLLTERNRLYEEAGRLRREVERLTEHAKERERVWTEHVARREAAMDDDKRATVKWAKRNAHELEAEAERLRETLRNLVKMNEEHNAAVEAVIGRPVGWTDTYLDDARAALAAGEEGGERE